MHKYGGFLIPAEFYDGDETTIDIEAKLGSDTYTGEIQLVAEAADAEAQTDAVPAVTVGDTIELSKSV